MKIGIFSDLHLRKGGPKIEGWDKRTLEGLDVLRQIVDVFIENKVDSFVFLGDFYHTRYKLDVQVLNGATDIIMGLMDIPGWFVPGNHDMYLKVDANINSLVSYSLKWNVVREIKKDNDFVFMPYTNNITKEDYEKINKLLEESKLKVLFVHQFLKGHPVQQDYVPKGGEVLNFSWINSHWIFAGHSHVRHSGTYEGRNNCISVGAPMDHSFVDSDCELNKRCIIFDTEIDKIRDISLIYPKYYTVDSIDQVKDDNNYYRLMVKESEFGKSISVPGNVQLKIIPEEKTTDRLHLGKKWVMSDVIKKYVDLKEKPEEYNEVGNKILKEVE
jgi:DNA repair exonuclease SbcCD nuclease subunit